MLFATMVAMVSLQGQAPALQESVPIGPPAALVSDGDYPQDAMQRGAQGIGTFMLRIGPDGVPVDCTIDGPVDPALDRRTCEIFRTRARFRPARDSEGRPVAGYYPGRMRWVLPGAQGSFAAGGMLAVTLVRTNAAGALACAASVNGRENRDPRIASCELIQQPAMIRAMRALGREAQLTLIVRMESGGMIPRGRTPSDSGPLVAESVARVTVDGGRVAECRLTSRRVPRPIAGIETAPGLCAPYPVGAVFPRTAGYRAGRQTVWIDARYHLREGPPSS